MAPVSSMTGFAVAARPTSAGSISIELRSVNSRFLDLTLRMADELRGFEAAVRETVGARIARGKVECRIGLQRHVAAMTSRVNADALAELARLAREVQAAVPAAAPLTTGDILRWDGIVETPEFDVEALRADLLHALAEALGTLEQTRRREGDALRSGLLARCDGIDLIVAQLRTRAPELLAAIERKLAERLDKALAPALTGTGTISREELNDRIRQEVTLYGLRADVDEELNRLATHVAEVRRVLDHGGAVGRRLDFLMQELNRESNTLGSKATAIEMTQAAVELKLLIEQMREQIQNLE
ncbi:MAG TPA: YicC/YloC family endoribonuclease [Burkholderiaceae bacterium]|nr:YicC/YloC family endoribonuclease [Burkholderiaceae bacterium]